MTEPTKPSVEQAQYDKFNSAMEKTSLSDELHAELLGLNELETSIVERAGGNERLSPLKSSGQSKGKASWEDSVQRKDGSASITVPVPEGATELTMEITSLPSIKSVSWHFPAEVIVGAIPNE